MNKDLQPIIEHIDELRTELKSDIKDAREDVQLLQKSVDNLTKTVKDFSQEHIVLDHRVEKLERKVFK